MASSLSLRRFGQATLPSPSLVADLGSATPSGRARLHVLQAKLHEHSSRASVGAPDHCRVKARPFVPRRNTSRMKASGSPLAAVGPLNAGVTILSWRVDGSGAATKIDTRPRLPSTAWRATLASSAWMKAVRSTGSAIRENGSSRRASGINTRRAGINVRVATVYGSSCVFLRRLGGREKGAAPPEGSGAPAAI
jgi:hypothetical protein